MTQDKNSTRLKEAAEILAMVDEILGSDLAQRPVVVSGIRTSLRSVRESVLRGCIDARRSEAAGDSSANGKNASSNRNAESVSITSSIEMDAIVPERNTTPDTSGMRISPALSEHLQNRRRSTTPIAE